MSKYVEFRIVRVGDHERPATRYRVTCRDAKTRAFVSSLSLPARRDGGSPPITGEVVAELLLGHYLPSVIEVEPEVWPLPSRLHRDGPVQKAFQPLLEEPGLN